MSKRKAPSFDSSTNKNKLICDALIELGEYEKNVTRQIFKYNAYRKAAASIMNHATPITSGKEASELPGVGKKIAAKIDELLGSGKLDKLNKIRADDSAVAIKELTRIFGIGPAFAKKLVDDGVRTIDGMVQLFINRYILDLKKRKDQLNHQQRIGLEYVDDFQVRIPRSEVTQIRDRVQETIEQIDPRTVMTVCGSYRRGAETSGDIDILITHPNYTTTDKSQSDVLNRLVDALIKSKLITDTLTHGEHKFMGVCKIDKLHRRIDILLLPQDQYFCGILYFTGSDEFNRQMRTIAQEKGYTLSEHSIRSVGSKNVPGESLPVYSEMDVFDYIGMEYKQPEERSM